jgi:hypothetical protein
MKSPGDLELTVPFSARARDRALPEALAGYAVRLVRGPAAAGLAVESAFRRHWWAAGDDAFRAYLQSAKWGAHKAARGAGADGLLTERWRRMRTIVHSDAWRLAFCRVRTPETAEYFRRAFRAAQQVWTRAARCEGQAINPFLAVAEAFRCGFWPLGLRDSAVWVFAVGEQDESPLELDSALPAGVACARPRIYASAEFEASSVVERWRPWLGRRGWDLVQQRVDEDASPPEVQLGGKIRECAGVLGLAEIDPDFGLPWWIFQDLDFAKACGLPVKLVAPREPGTGAEGEEVEQWLETLRQRWRL